MKPTSTRHARHGSWALNLAAIAWTAACAGGSGREAPETIGAVPPAAPAGPVCRDGSESTLVSFPDAGLERAVRTTVGVGPEATLTCEVLARVTRLHAPDAGITDLSGIENLVRLGELHIYGYNSIRDVTPLAHLRALSDLSLARNRIEDVGPLGDVRTLTSLDLYGNPIRDVGALGRLEGLIRLRIGSGTRLVGLEALAGLTRLSRLELLDNAVGDATPLGALSQLTRLSLEGNPHLSDLTPLGALQNLEILELGGTAVSDLRPLSGLMRLTTLGLAGTHVHDLSPLIGLLGLTRLDLRGDMLLSDVQPLLYHPALGTGDAVRLEGSAVSCTDVAALEARGLIVFSTCR
jgi:hypothetical protein